MVLLIYLIMIYALCGCVHATSFMAGSTTAPSFTHRPLEELVKITGDGPLNVSSTMIQKIFLWTKDYMSGADYELLDLNSKHNITNSHFSGDRQTYVMVHGFLGNGLEPWIIGIKDKLLSKGDYNVISVQWPAGSEYFVIDYYHVVYHVPVVGSEIADLLDLLSQYKDLSYDRVHIIGHSLGAHIAGFVGKNLDESIGRITGLDPAGLTYRGTDATKRLDKTDATFVDVIHTNACRKYIVWTDCFGLDMNIGHVDFWPNGGKHQPACHGINKHKNKKILSELHKRRNYEGHWSIGCDHMLSHTYFLESLDYDGVSREFMARPCDTYRHFKDGECVCGRLPQFMGFNADFRSKGVYFLNTSDTPPFALPDCPGFHPTLTLFQASLSLLPLYLFCISLIILVSVLFTSRCTVGCCCHMSNTVQSFHGKTHEKIESQLSAEEPDEPDSVVSDKEELLKV